MDNHLQCVNDVTWNNIADFYSDSRNHSCDVCNGSMKSKVHDNYVFRGHNRMRYLNQCAPQHVSTSNSHKHEYK